MDDLIVEGLRVTIGRSEVLAGVDLCVGAGECVGIVGPNGAGKSTLLNVLTGLQPPSGGQIFWRGQKVTSWSTARRVEGGLVRSFEAGAVWGRVGVLDNVALGSLRKQPLSAARNGARTALETVDVVPENETEAGQLSLGMARRVELARLHLRIQELRAQRTTPSLLLLREAARRLGMAPGLLDWLIAEPREQAAPLPLVLLDEPLRGLDVASKDRLLELLIADLRGRATIVFVEHDRPRASRLADRLIYMEAGRVRPESPTRSSPPDEPSSVDIGHGSAGPSLLELRAIRAGYGVHEVLSGVDLDLRGGRGVHLTGPNGCGKSTLLTVIAGVLPGARGSLNWKGHQIAASQPRAGVVWVPQGGRLIPSLTVAEHIELARRPGGVGDAFALAVPGVVELSSRPAAALSAGQRSLAALWIAFSAAPSLLLLDEPTAALAPMVRSLVLGFLRGWLSTDRAYVIVEHGVVIPGAAIRCMEGGRLVNAPDPSL